MLKYHINRVIGEGGAHFIFIYCFVDNNHAPNFTFTFILNLICWSRLSVSVRKMQTVVVVVVVEEMGERGIDSDLQLHSLSGQSSGWTWC